MPMIYRKYLKKTLTSSNITTSAQNLTDLSYGEWYVKDVLVKCDATGLAAGTNFTIQSTNAKGVAAIFTTAISGLGANTSIDLDNASVTKKRTVLESGAKLQYLCSGINCTGAGTIDVYIVLERVDTNAYINLV